MPTPVSEKPHPRTEAALERLRTAMRDIEAKVQEAKQKTLRRLAKELGQTVSPMSKTA